MDIIDIKKAGIIGCGGAGFPTYFKLNSKVDTLIINGAECEPLLETDKELMRHHMGTILEGIKIAKELTGAKEVFLGIKNYYSDVIEIARKYENGNIFKVFPLDNIYPIGDEHLLVEAITGKIIPEGGIPLDVNVVVQNVETIFHIGKLSQNKENFTHRFITITGEVEFPFVAYVPIGTPISYLLDMARPKILLSDAVIFDGGPMMGKITSEDEFTRKTTSGIIIVPKWHKLVRQRTRDIETIKRISRSACIQCRRCTDYCPRYLNGHNIEPHRWMRKLALNQITPEEMVFLCVECGVCELYACPMDISPRLVARLIKQVNRENNIKNEHYHNKPERKRSFSEYRKLNTLKLMEHLDIAKYNVHPHLEQLNITPERVRIYLNQHIGKPSKPIVKENDRIQVGETIAESDKNDLGVDYHASIEGKIYKITPNYIEIVRQ